MRDLAVVFLHLLTTLARLAGPGGARAVVAESVLVKHQLLILNPAVCTDILHFPARVLVIQA